MKKTIIPAIVIAISMFTFGCKKTEDAKPYTCQTCKTTPDALAANDASSKGVYKGVMAGSTGTIMFSILNGNNTLTATLVIDGVTVALTTTSVWAAGSPFSGVFTGTLSGNPVSITLSVNADGSNPSISAFNITGHTGAIFVIIKETSAALIECFEGTYNTTRPETGVFNLIANRTAKVYTGYSLKLTGGGGNGGPFNGVLTATNQLQDASGGGIMGTLSGDVISGTFQDGNGRTVNIAANRTW